MSNHVPSDEQIRVRAYEVFLRRGDAPGSPADDWRQAEAELQHELQQMSRHDANGASNHRPTPKGEPRDQQHDQPIDGSAPPSSDAPPRKSVRSVRSNAASRRSH